MSDGSDPYGHALRAIQSLRGWGAVSVRVGDISATFAPGLAALLPDEPPAKEMTAEEREKEAERIMFASAGG